MWISLSLSLILLACNADNAAQSRNNRLTVDPAAALTEQVRKDAAASVAKAEKESQQQVSGGGRENPEFLNGIDDQNRGDKVGKVAFSGSIPNRNGMLYLFETEGRNIAVMDSTRINNGRFDFGRVEVGRGFYGLGFEPGKKTADVFLNPDEDVLQINFQNARLVGGQTDSRENRAWFAYRGAESANSNQVRQLYKQRRGNEAAIDAQVEAKQKELAQTQHKFIRENLGTYMAKFLTWKQPRFIGDKGTFLSDMDMSDNSLIRSMALPDRIQSMMRTFSEGKDSGFLSCIDLVKASCLSLIHI